MTRKWDHSKYDLWESTTPLFLYTVYSLKHKVWSNPNELPEVSSAFKERDFGQQLII